jgi:hypothetical protein
MSNADNASIWENENGVQQVLPDGWRFVDLLEVQYDLGDNVVLSIAPKYLGRGAYSETQWELQKISSPFADNDEDDFDVVSEMVEASDWNDACSKAMVIMNVGA